MKFGKSNFKEFQEFAEKFEKAADESEAFIERCTKELAARLLAKVIPLTPVKDGVLKRGWISTTHADAETGGDVTSGEIKQHAEGIEVRKVGKTFEIEVKNPVLYALYREYGHFTRDRETWVEGSFMLTMSEEQLQSEMPRILKRKLNEFFKEVT